MNVPRDIIDALAAARRPVLAGHTGPDVDSLGAMLALARAMPADGAAVTLGGKWVSPKLDFMLDLTECPVVDEAGETEADVIIVLDTANTRRINLASRWELLADRFVVNIDHHITNSDYGQLNWVVDNGSSTCELVYHLIVAAGWPLDGVTASLLLAGMHADTCGFSLPTVTADTFDAAGALIRAGADLDVVGGQLYRSLEANEFRLIRTVYHNTHLALDGRLAYSTLSLEEILAAGCTPEHIDDQVSIPRSLSGIRIAVLLSEVEPGVVRVNLRGEDGTPVLPLAAVLGGGGHEFSAGVRMRSSLPKAVERILTEAGNYLTGAVAS